MRNLPALLIAVVLLVLFASPVAAQQPIYESPQHADPSERMGFDQRLGAALPLDLVFSDENGQAVTLGDYFAAGKPVVLTLGYYECPVLCSLVRQGMARDLAELSFKPGQDFTVVSVSINPNETAMAASAEKAAIISRYGDTSTADGWHFLVGEQPSIDALAEAIGFRYYYDESIQQYAHPSGLVMITPSGLISRYFYGIDFPPTDLRLGLVESSENQIGSLTDKFLLLCYKYNPETGRYSGYIMGMVRIAGAFTALTIATVLFVGWLRGPKAPPSGPAPAHG